MTMTISVVLGIVIILIVMFGFTGTVASVIDVVGRYISYFSGPALASFLLAMFTTRASDRGTAIGFLVSRAICSPPRTTPAGSSIRPSAAPSPWW